jgi:hypothetical protein
MSKQLLSFLFWLGIFLLLVPALIHAYLLMPFPGSQDLEAISFVYYLEKIVLPSRIIGFLLIVWPLWQTLSSGNWKERIIRGSVFALCLGLFYFTDWMYKAERMFEEPGVVRFADAQHNQVPDSLLVIGVVEGNVAKAYPVNYLGYHHKVQDSVGTTPVLVTYCTMCRTGRVYSPVINGKYQAFRLVGARHYNAVIEDPDTKSWWYQATGEAAAGPLKGQMLQEINAEQLSLASWLDKYPHSLILQPDSTFAGEYNALKRYDRLQPIDRDSTLSPDTLIRKSWVVGVIVQGKAKAYDWKQLQKHQLVNDTIGQVPVVVMLEKDSLSFHVWNRKIDNQALEFVSDSAHPGFRDTASQSLWDYRGLCTEGNFKGKRLSKILAYQEYWHSWKFFHPSTTLWRGDNKSKPLAGN